EEAHGAYRDRLAVDRGERLVAAAHPRGAPAGDDHTRQRQPGGGHGWTEIPRATSCQPRRRPVDTAEAGPESPPRPMEAWDDMLDRAAECLVRAHHTIALTGAGLSVESGIPPFRGPGGLWTRHGEPPMDGYQRFLRDPRRAWEERLNPAGPMRELWEALAAARPNPGHLALVELEDLGILKCTITPNHD